VVCLRNVHVFPVMFAFVQHMIAYLPTVLTYLLSTCGCTWQKQILAQF